MNIIIVDDDRLISKSLKMMLSKEKDIEVFGVANDGAEGVELCEKTKPDIVLMDIRMPHMDGIQATRIIKREHPHIQVMMLTTFQDKDNIKRALQAGAGGYLLKTDKITHIAEKLRLLYKGTSILDQTVLKTITHPEIPLKEKLTPREVEVAHWVAEGLTNKEISETLHLSEGRIRNILSIIMGKLEVKNRNQLSAIINKNKII
ncbi:LuxR family two component transcriptional regulator [Natranaerovirga hydrolytica]|uniref:Stage 0 sporulation protein A homolog n=1 Tax=Natranaerovirga hydrolytica TaxID=680378 RepID=A0A4R1ML24_9FIRM|nr:response regulator transcription factor [Natranaerovirga hydrolytica]TCK92760.1 LuxR family two component transcriptional regulator [Natranaerovirga hydrolytica]